MVEDLIRQIQSNISNYPDMRIIVDQGENNGFTYRQYDEYARKIAAKLQRMGV